MLEDCFLAYADDIVLLAPSWKALQSLIQILCDNAKLIDMSCNVNKTVCMVFNPKNRNNIVSKNFPQFTMGNMPLQFVPEFKYLGHVITNDCSDDKDIQREVRSMFFRTNLLVSRFSRCSTAVKVALFKAYQFVCVYMMQLCGKFTMWLVLTNWYPTILLPQVH